jgi:cytochrome c oxidase subunit 2
MALGIVIILLVIGSVLFHFLSPWYFTPIASNWSAVDFTIDVTFWVTGIVFVIVNLFLAYAVIRFRNRKGSGQTAAYEPENKKLEYWLTGITAVGVVLMLAPGLFVWARVVTVPPDAMLVEAVGQQWHWSYRYPGEDEILGAIDPKLISPDNPFGVDPRDEHGQDDVLVANPQMHVPLDKPVKTILRSKDVLHDFAVPQFRVKMDLVPGTVTYLWFAATRLGTFEILCEELCGIGHHTMRGEVVVDTPEDFEKWLADQPTFAELAAVSSGDPVLGETQYATCAACHGFEGEGLEALNAPKLAGMDPWYLKRQILNYKSGVRGAAEGDIYGAQMAAMSNTMVNDAAIHNVAAYLQTLPDVAPAGTVEGDLENGRRLYQTCGTCHGRQGQGIWSLNAPRAQGLNDWYLVQQLKNFRDGLRGAHPEDYYGAQMKMMADILTRDEYINDLVAYINTLPPPEQQSAQADNSSNEKL